MEIAAEEAIVRRMLDSPPDDLLAGRESDGSRSNEAHVISLGEFGCSPIAFVKECPTGPNVTDPIFNGVWAIANRVEDVKAEAERVGKDPLLSPEGRIDKIRGTWARVRESANQLKVYLTAEAPQIDDTENKLFSVPALDATDVAKALEAVEIRRWFGDLDPATRLKYTQEMYAGQHEDMILALARAPVPGLKRDFARAAWRAHVERKDRELVRGVAKRRDRLQWAQAALRCVEDRVAEWERKNAPKAKSTAAFAPTR